MSAPVRVYLFCLLTFGLASATHAQDARSTVEPPAAAATTPSGDHVQFLDGDVLEGRVDHRTPFLKSEYLLVDSMRVGMEDVFAYRSGDGYFRRIDGRGHRFARRTRQGRIDLYVRTESHVNPGAMSGMPGAGAMPTTSSVDAKYFAKGDEAVQRISYGSLRDVLADNPESLRYLDQYRNLGYTQIGLAAAGLGLIAVGMTQLERPENGETASVPPLLFIGAGVASTAWIPHLMRDGKLEQAVDVYNR